MTFPSGSRSFQMLGTAHPMAQHHIPDDSDIWQHHLSVSSLVLLSTVGWSTSSTETCNILYLVPHHMLSHARHFDLHERSTLLRNTGPYLPKFTKPSHCNLSFLISSIWYMLRLTQYKRNIYIYNFQCILCTFQWVSDTPFTHAATEKLFHNQFISGTCYLCN